MMITGMLLGGLIVGAFAFAESEPAKEDHPLVLAYLTQLDNNKDKKITLDEFSAKAVWHETLKFTSISQSQQGRFGPIFTPITSHSGVAAIGRDPVSLGKDIQVDTSPTKYVWAKTACRSSLAEIKQGEIVREFYSLDTNGDNQLSATELKHTHLLPTLERLKSEYYSLDTNHDGSLTASEINSEFSRAKIADEPIIQHYSVNKILETPLPCLNQNTAREGQAATDTPIMSIVWPIGREPFRSLQIKGGGLNDELFAHLDRNSDNRLSFNEFTFWYL